MNPSQNSHANRIAVAENFIDLNRENRHAIVAVSGGVDSLALLSSLSALVPHKDMTPVFVCHGIRSKKEETKSLKATQEACDVLGIKNLVVWHEPGKPLHSKSSESDARNLRYSCLAESAGDDGCIVTAHHADDQLETLIMRLSRGSGIRGLSGIPSISSLPIEHKKSPLVIRPMLSLCKEDCVDICKDLGIQWHEDVTNKKLDNPRNAIRHKVIPEIKKFYPKASQKASTAAEQIRVIADDIDAAVHEIRKLESKSQDSISISRPFLKTLPKHVVGTYLRDAFSRIANRKGLGRINNIKTNRLIRLVFSNSNDTTSWASVNIEVKNDNVVFTRKGRYK